MGTTKKENTSTAPAKITHKPTNKTFDKMTFEELKNTLNRNPIEEFCNHGERCNSY